MAAASSVVFSPRWPKPKLFCSIHAGGYSAYLSHRRFNAQSSHERTSEFLSSTSKLVDIQVNRQRLSFTGAYWGRGNPTPQADIVRYISQPVDAPKVLVEPRPLFDIISQATGTLPIRRFSSNGCVRDQILQLTTTSIGGIKPDGLLKHWNHEHIHVPQLSPTTGSLTFPALNLQAC